MNCILEFLLDKIVFSTGFKLPRTVYTRNSILLLNLNIFQNLFTFRVTFPYRSPIIFDLHAQSQREYEQINLPKTITAKTFLFQFRKSDCEDMNYIGGFREIRIGGCDWYDPYIRTSDRPDFEPTVSRITSTASTTTTISTSITSSTSSTASTTTGTASSTYSTSTTKTTSTAVSSSTASTSYSPINTSRTKNSIKTTNTTSATTSTISSSSTASTTRITDITSKLYHVSKNVLICNHFPM